MRRPSTSGRKSSKPTDLTDGTFRQTLLKCRADPVISDENCRAAGPAPRRKGTALKSRNSINPPPVKQTRILALQVHARLRRFRKLLRSAGPAARCVCSLTVEAAMAFPLFLFAVYLLILPMRMMRTSMQMQQICEQTCELLAPAARKQIPQAARKKVIPTAQPLSAALPQKTADPRENGRMRLTRWSNGFPTRVSRPSSEMQQPQPSQTKTSRTCFPGAPHT